MSSRSNFVSIVILALMIVVIAATGLLGFQLGRYAARYSVIEERQRAEDYGAQVAELERTVDELGRQVAVLETSRDIDRETYSEVESNLSQLQSRIQSQEEELAFYQSIVSPDDGVSGLRVQTLELLPGDSARRFLLRLVLVQAIVHSQRVSGSVKLTIDGRLDGGEVTLELGQLTGDEHVDGMPYDFLYFTSIEHELELPEGFEPEAVNLEISPVTPRGQAIEQHYDWSEVARV